MTSCMQPIPAGLDPQAIPELVARMTDEDVQAAYAALEQIDPAVWCERHCVIAPKGGGRLVPLRANTAQQRLDALAAQLRQAGRPVRLIVLKARQLGVTTWGLSRMYHRITTRPNHLAALAAHKDKSTAQLFDRVKLFYRYDPQRLPTDYSNRKELIYSAPHHSSLWVSTASPELGRSGMLIDFHGSEVAYWPNAAETLTAVLECVPKPLDNPDTMVILESTANGQGGEFYDRWCRATPAERSPWVTLPRGGDPDGFLAVFLPWHACPEYRLPVHGEFVRTDAEQRLAERYGLTDEQLAWRRYVIEHEMAGDEDRFRQEYPSCDSEAFLTSGRPVFPPTRIQVMLAHARPPAMIGLMGGSPEAPEFRPVDRRRGEGLICEIWQPPRGLLRYAIGADTAEGLDPTDSNDTDRNSAHVACVESHLVAAKLSGRADPDLFGEQLNLLGRWYHNALLGVEVNNSSGGSTRSTLKRLRYPNLFYRERIDRTTDEMTEILGWLTDKATRETMITDLIRAIREGSLHVLSAETIRQMQSFVRDAKGRPAAAPGEHDDDVMSLAITWQMVIRAAAEASSVPAERVPAVAGIPAWSEADGFTPDMLIGGREPDIVAEYTDEEDEGGW